MSTNQIIKVNLDKSPELIKVNIICLEYNPNLGFVFQMMSVEKLQSGTFSMNYEKIRLNNADYYGLSTIEKEVLKLIESYETEKLISKFYKGSKKMNAKDFFEKYVTPDIKVKSITPYIDLINKKILNLIRGNTIYYWGKGTLNKWIPVKVEDEPLELTYHINKLDTGLVYRISVKHKNKTINIHSPENEIIVNQPANVLLNQSIYFFSDNQDAKKLTPFFTKKEIPIAENAEELYLKKFILPIAEEYNLKSEGIKINYINSEPQATIKFMIFSSRLNIGLQFKYNDLTYNCDEPQRGKAELKKENGNWVIHLAKRNTEFEKQMYQALVERGLSYTQGALFNLPEKVSVEDFIKFEVPALEEIGFEINQGNLKKPFMLKSPEMVYGVSEKNDWFDVDIKIRFGLYEVPFKKLKNNILSGNRFYELPDGSIAILPEEWINILPPLYDFYEDGGNKIKLGKFHFQMLESLKDLGNGISDYKIEHLKEALKLQGKITLSDNFKTKLRKYQTQGVKWLITHNKNNLGCLLADDMGLGKTIQTLSFFDWFINEKYPDLKDNRTKDLLGNTSNINLDKSDLEKVKLPAFLVVAPATLIHNWSSEIAKFTELTYFIYGGIQRNKNIASYFNNYEIILTTYGTLRNDLEIFSKINFDVVVFDEAQNLKNPVAATSRACLALPAKQKILLSGTPVENSVNDLWSLMNIANPGILGNFSQFNNTYNKKIYTKDSVEYLKLKTITEPFILRRTKEDVAKELPPKHEQVLYCQMTTEQKELYDKTKSFFRNELLATVKEKGFAGSRMHVLKGLLRLRQLSIHPVILDSNYIGESGKFNTIIENLENVISSGHKVLFFSQFVSNLKLFKAALIEKEIHFAYIDGTISGEDRIKQVKLFQNNENCKVLLSSLKAGGTGLNLTKADYVFLADPWWNPAVERQAMDRAHRIGRNKPVFVYKFITEETVEEKILNLQNAKKRLTNELITENANWLSEINEDDLTALLS